MEVRWQTKGREEGTKLNTLFKAKSMIDKGDSDRKGHDNYLMEGGVFKCNSN